MFTHLFYLLCLLRVVYEFFWIVTAKERIKSFVEFKAKTKSLENTPVSMWPSEYMGTILRFMLKAFLHAFLFIGVFSHQWFIVILFLVWDILIINLITRKMNQILYLGIHWINSWITIGVFLYLIINHYHLHHSTSCQINWLLSFFHHLWS